jgi:ornithine cyclodeaminase/alanine dehydrogenase
VTLDYDCYWTAEGLASADALFTDDVGQLQHLKAYGYFVGLEGGSIDRTLWVQASGVQ